LPVQLSASETEKVVIETIFNIGRADMKDMGKVMGIVGQKLVGKADGKTI